MNFKQNYNFSKMTVCPKFQLWGGSFLLLFTWYCFYSERAVFFPFLNGGCLQNAGIISYIVAYFLIFSVLFVGMPLGIILASWELRIDGNHLYVSKYFGFIKKMYTFQNFEHSKVNIRREGTNYENIKIEFHDGITLRLDPFCVGYSRFKEILQHIKLI